MQHASIRTAEAGTTVTLLDPPAEPHSHTPTLNGTITNQPRAAPWELPRRQCAVLPTYNLQHSFNLGTIHLPKTRHNSYPKREIRFAHFPVSILIERLQSPPAPPLRPRPPHRSFPLLSALRPISRLASFPTLSSPELGPILGLNSIISVCCVLGTLSLVWLRSSHFPRDVPDPHPPPLPSSGIKFGFDRSVFGLDHGPVLAPFSPSTRAAHHHPRHR